MSVYDGGMTLRDYFAAKGIEAMKLDNVEMASEKQMADGLALIANICYQLADAMLKAREA